MAYLYRKNHLIPRIKYLLESCGLQTSVKDESGRIHPVLTAHSFRHTFISKAANAGIPFAQVQLAVGHTTAEQSRHYFHEDEDATLRAFAAFPTATTPAITNNDVVEVEARIVDGTSTRDARLAALDAALDAILEHGDAAEIEAALVRARRLEEARRACK